MRKPKLRRLNSSPARPDALRLCESVNRILVRRGFPASVAVASHYFHKKPFKVPISETIAHLDQDACCPGCNAPVACSGDYCGQCFEG